MGGPLRAHTETPETAKATESLARAHRVAKSTLIFSQHKKLLPLRQGAHAAGAGSMERFVRHENIRRYRELLKGLTDETERQRILKLLEEEQQKQRDAGDQMDS